VQSLPYVRIYTGPDEETHFEDCEVAFSEGNYAPPALAVQVSAPTPARQAVFVAAPPGFSP
jgi:hypothetical protein